MDDNQTALLAMTNTSSKTPMIITGIVLVLITVFVVAIVIYVYFFQSQEMHEIVVKNTNQQPVNIIFGAFSGDGNVKYLPSRKLSQNQSYTYKSTPGTSIIVQGYRDKVIFDDRGIAFATAAELVLAGEGFSKTEKITDGEVIIDGLASNENRSDQYGISMKYGYNISIDITSTANNNKNTSNPFSCVGPIWNHEITATGTYSCPDILQFPGTGPEYQACLPPCQICGFTGVTGLTGCDNYCCLQTGACSMTGGCQESWPNKSYYDVFASACPNCLITNCDKLNYTCGSKDGLTQYLITFK